MFSIRKLLGQDEKFFDLLEASAQQADSSVHELVALLAKLEHGDSPQSLEAFVHSRREDKRITQELTEQLCKTFITPLEREDIQALATALYKIPKTVERIGERILICPQDLHGRSFAKQVEFLDQAAEAVLAMVKELRKGTDIATVRDMNDNLQTIEGDAGQQDIWKAATLERWLHGMGTWFRRRAKDNGRHRAGDICRDQGGQAGASADGVWVFIYAEV